MTYYCISITILSEIPVSSLPCLLFQWSLAGMEESDLQDMSISEDQTAQLKAACLYHSRKQHVSCLWKK